MSGPVAVIVGQVRVVTDRRKKPEPGSQSVGEIFGTEVSILTEVGGVLGETIPVLMFKNDYVPVVVGQQVEYVVELDAGRFGLQGVFKKDVSPAIA